MPVHQLARNRIEAEAFLLDPSRPHNPRLRLEPGDFFRASGGPYSLSGRGLGPVGLFRLVRVIVSRRRIYLDAVHVVGAESSGQFLLYVEGNPYRRAGLPGVIWRPYRVRKVAP